MLRCVDCDKGATWCISHAGVSIPVYACDKHMAERVQDTRLTIYPIRKVERIAKDKTERPA